VIRLDLPLLGERRQDIPLLAEHFLHVISSSMGRRIEGFAPGVMQALCSYAWPGNVRELRNVIEQALVMTQSELITFESLPANVRQTLAIPDHIQKKDHERYLRFAQAYQDLEGNITQVAKALEISRPTVYAWREKFGLG
jgi:two-component system response regulator GlrR